MVIDFWKGYLQFMKDNFPSDFLTRLEYWPKDGQPRRRAQKPWVPE